MTPPTRNGIILLLLAGALMFYRSGDGPSCTACSVVAKEMKEAAMAKPAESCPDCATEANVPVLSAPAQRPWDRPVSEPAFAEFRDWTSRYLSAEPGARAALEVEGVRLATVRQRAMANMITAQPERALALAVPYGVRHGLPGSITPLLESPVNAMAEYQVMAARPVQGGEDAITPVVREAVVNGVRHAVYTFGAAENYVSKSRVPVNGIALPASAATNPPAALNGAPERLMALDPNPARTLDDEETQDYLASSDKTPVCPSSGSEVTVNKTPGVVEIGGDLHAFCGSVHAQQWAAAAIEGAGLNTPDGAAAAAGDVVAASGYTEGSKRFLFLRVKFTDSGSAEADTIPQATADSLLAGMVTHMAEISYDKLKIAPAGPAGSAVSTVLSLNHPASYYNDAGLSKLYPDARTAATAAGYNLGDYQFFAVFTRGRPSAGYAGLAYVGGIGIHIANAYWGRSVLTHELGHNLGLPHAHSWDTATNSIIGDGTNVEYGNNYDPIGSGGDNDHYVGSYKRYLDWIPGADGDPVTAPGIYRLYAMDNIYGNQGLRTLTVKRNSSQEYSFDFRGDRSEAQFQNGLFAHFCNNDGLQSYLLDCTPRQNNIAQPIGRTFVDPTAGVYVTPLRTNSSYPESMDVAVYFTTAGNHAPRAKVVCHSPQIPAGSEVLFTAEATDADGDELAYSWDFGDGNYSMDNAPHQTHVFSADGEYPVQCTVGDLKGGTFRRTIPVQVGAPVSGQYHITGRVTDAANKPLSGIRLYTDDSHYCWSDTDGSYFLARIPAGTVTVKIREMVENKLGFTPVFTNPVALSAHRSGADFAISSAPPEILTNLVSKLSTWKYNDLGTDLGVVWRGTGYSDTGWASGAGMLGYGNGGEGTIVSYGSDANNKRTTCYFRRTFTVA
ncbi:MAG TPA: PKD domain-containing protein, partial [Verrucomicrobiales bacterium]|nr:PKD domain-containing protein [Verrucomicrobiales bacterium]